MMADPDLVVAAILMVLAVGVGMGMGGKVKVKAEVVEPMVVMQFWEKQGRRQRIQARMVRWRIRYWCDFVVRPGQCTVLARIGWSLVRGR